MKFPVCSGFEFTDGFLHTWAQVFYIQRKQLLWFASSSLTRVLIDTNSKF